MKGKEANGHSLFMDNFYNSHDLSKDLLEVGTHTTGTLQCNRKNLPKDVVQKKLEKGDTICQFSEKKVMVGKWRDKRAVLYITTEFDNVMTEGTNKRGQSVKKTSSDS
uniref:PiggyBac transposable element-derived protein domain-containing protein n=1 Tax=Clastoptera arizonana TaxID=38151 RepID=A0A1B6DUW0_9HEMI